MALPDSTLLPIPRPHPEAAAMRVFFCSMYVLLVVLIGLGQWIAG